MSGDKWLNEDITLTVISHSFWHTSLGVTASNLGKGFPQKCGRTKVGSEQRILFMPQSKFILSEGVWKEETHYQCASVSLFTLGHFISNNFMLQKSTVYIRCLSLKRKYHYYFYSSQSFRIQFRPCLDMVMTNTIVIVYTGHLTV